MEQELVLRDMWRLLRYESRRRCFQSVSTGWIWNETGKNNIGSKSIGSNNKLSLVVEIKDGLQPPIGAAWKLHKVDGILDIKPLVENHDLNGYETLRLYEARYTTYKEMG